MTNPFTEDAMAIALQESHRLSSELDVTNADHISIWLEANPPLHATAWLAVQIAEAHERALPEVEAMPEKDALLAQAGDLLENYACLLADTADKFDALVKHNEQLRGALVDLVSWFPETSPSNEWRIPAGEQGADDAVVHARAFLARHEASDGGGA